LAVDKDHQPKWNPRAIADVRPELVDAFFKSPWDDASSHPLAGLEAGV